MKLIRLTTTDNNVNFNSFFNEDILIKPYSKIALQTLSIESNIQALVINGSNDLITFNVRATAEPINKTISLTHSGIDGTPIEYNKDNYNILLDEITLKLNESMDFNAGKELGLQFNVHINNKNKINIQALQSDFNNRFSLLNNNKENLTSTTSGTDKNWNSSLATATNDYSNFSFLEYPITKGAGVFQFQIKTLINDGIEEENGFVMGLTNKPVDAYPEGITESDIVWGIEATYRYNDGTTDPHPYNIIEDGMKTTTSVMVNLDDASPSNNDYVNITISEGQILGIIFGNVTDQILFQDDYDNITNLYPFFCIKSKNTNCRLTKFRFTTDPYLEAPLSIHQEYFELGTPSPPVGTGLKTPSSQFLLFEKLDICEFLGYNNLRIPVDGYNKSRNVNFIADDEFEITSATDSFIVLLDNLQLNSYDSLKQSRQNILSVIPKSDSNSVILYEPNNLIFIDLNNEQPIILRNFKARVLKSDYSNVLSYGLSSLTILVKSSDE
tara:strand:- start:1697 stop:3193 length:1497 start_codon:yes stop_codon:yes gene_type:complete